MMSRAVWLVSVAVVDVIFFGVRVPPSALADQPVAATTDNVKASEAAKDLLRGTWETPRPDRFDVRFRITRTIRQGTEVRHGSTDDWRVCFNRNLERAVSASRSKSPEVQDTDRMRVEEKMNMVQGSTAYHVATTRIQPNKRESFLDAIAYGVPFHPGRVGLFDIEVENSPSDQDRIDELLTDAEECEYTPGFRGNTSIKMVLYGRDDRSRYAVYRWGFDSAAMLPASAKINYHGNSRFGDSDILVQRTIRDEQGRPVLQTATGWRYGDPFNRGVKDKYDLIEDIEFQWNDPQSTPKSYFEIPENVEQRIEEMLARDGSKR